MPDERVVDRPLLIRTQGNPIPVVTAVEKVINSIDPQVLVTASTLEEGIRQSPVFIVSTLAAAVASSIGALGFLLTVVGIFGTVSYVVALRTREVGIRLAIGAQRHDVIRLILGESSRPVVFGLIAGNVLTGGVVYALRGILYGVNAGDSLIFVVLSFVFLVAALVASYPPMGRAMQVDPAVALRYE